MGKFLLDHYERLLTFYTCLESQPHLLKRLSNSQQSWVPATKRWAIPITTNAAEHIFRFFRRYTKNMEQFRTKEWTERFFNLFAFFANVRTLRTGQKAGDSLLAAAHVDLCQIFGTDDPYTILGFPPAHQPVIPHEPPHSVPQRVRRDNILTFPVPRRVEKTVQFMAA